MLAQFVVDPGKLAALQEDFRGPQNTLLIALRKYAVPAVGLGSADERVFEHDRRHPLGARHFDAFRQLLQVDVRLKTAQGGGDFAGVDGEIVPEPAGTKPLKAVRYF